MKTEMDLFRGSLWNPARELTELQRSISRIFGDVDGTKTTKNFTEVAFAPACDIEETEGQYLMSLDIPGLRKEDIRVELNDRDLIISGERKEEKKEDKKSRHVVERYYGSFRRAVTLPSTINAENIQASYENGVLKIAIPKTETAKSKQIAVTDGKTKDNNVRIAY